MVAYLGVAYLTQSRAARRNADRFFVSKIFDSATFSGSAMLLMGIVDPVVLRLIGNTKPFLLIAGLAGVVYSIRVLFPERDH